MHIYCSARQESGVQMQEMWASEEGTCVFVSTKVAESVDNTAFANATFSNTVFSASSNAAAISANTTAAYATAAKPVAFTPKHWFCA